MNRGRGRDKDYAENAEATEFAEKREAASTSVIWHPADFQVQLN